MSENNGHTESWRERLDRVEASHVKLMTYHEVFVREQEKAWQREDKAWRRLRKRERERDEAYDRRFKEMGEALDARIARLVTAIGTFVGAKPQGGAQ